MKPLNLSTAMSVLEWGNSSSVGTHLFVNEQGAGRILWTPGYTGLFPNGEIDVLPSVGAVNTNSFSQIVATCDTVSGTAALYLNGVLIGTNSYQPPIVSGTAYTLFIGHRPLTADPNPFTGELDDIRIYIRALSASEVQQLYKYESGSTTNVVQTINISLTGFEQTGGNSSEASTFRITTKDVMKDLAQATGTPFSSGARLTAITTPGGDTSFVVVEGGTNNQTDVSSILRGVLVGTPVARAKMNTRGRSTGTQWSIQSFTYGATDTNGAATTGFTFSVQGFTTIQLANGAFNSSVNGTGARNNGDPLVLRGSIMGSAGKFQKVSLSQ